MGLFKKKEQKTGKEEEVNVCHSGENCNFKGKEIKVLGSGCAKCNQLETAVREALLTLGMEPVIDHVTDFSQIAAYGVMTTPALVIEGRVVSSGKVLKKEEVIALLRKGGEV